MMASVPAPEEQSNDLDRLRVAAREVLAATRGLLDAVEDVLADDERVRSIADGIGDAVRSVTDAVRDLGSSRSREAPADPDGRVERITVE
jgi:hypothetical protein